MVRKVMVALLTITMLVGCSNKEKDHAYKKLVELCNQLQLQNCFVDFTHTSDTNTGQKDKLSINIEETPNTDAFYKQNPRYLCGLVAYEIYLTVDSIGSIDKYSNLKLHGLINGKDLSEEYAVKKLQLVQSFVGTVNDFLKDAVNQDAERIKSYTSSKHIPDSILISILQGVNYMAKCGKITEIKLLGMRFDKIKETGEEVTVIEEYIKRERSEEQFTFYILNEDKRIIFIDMKSSMDCV